MSNAYRTPVEVPAPDLTLSTFDVALPSRAVLQFRPIGAKEMSAVGKNNASAQQRLFSLLQSCHVGTSDRGPYNEAVIGGEASKATWSRVPWGDVFYAVVGLYKGSFRRLVGDDNKMADLGGEIVNVAYGDMINFDFTCQGCRKLCNWSVPTDAILSNCTPIQDDVYDRYSEGLDLVAKLHGKDVLWLPPTFQRDKPFLEMLEKQGQVEETVVELLAKYLTRVPLDDGRKQDARAIWMWCLSLSMDDVDSLLDQIDRDNWGLNSLISVDCDKCGMEQAQMLPFGQIFASRRTTASKLIAKAKRIHD